MLSAETLYARAMADVDRGRFAAGRRALRLALARADEPLLRARVLLSLAYQESERGHVNDGIQLINEAASIPDLPDHTMGVLGAGRGLMLMRTGDQAGALSELNAAMRVLDDREPAVLVKTLLNRGNVFLQARELAAAHADFQRCADLAAEHSLDIFGAQARHNMGYVDMLAGELPSALREMDAVRRALSDLSPVFVAVCDADRAEVMTRAGLFSQADDSLATAAAAFGSRRLRQSQAEAELARAQLALASQRLAQAIRLARRARARFAQRGAETWVLQCDLVALAARVRLNRRLTSAVVDGTALAVDLRKRGLGDDALTASLWVVSALIRQGELDRAHSLLVRCRLTARSPITTRLLAHSVRSELALAGRGRRAAGTAVRRGLSELHSWQSSFGSLDLQTGVVAHGRDLARQGLRLAVADGRPAAVFDWSERARAFASRVAPVRPPADPAAEAALAELRQLRIEIREGELSGTVDAPMRRRSEELEEQIRSRALYPPGPGVVTEPLQLGEVQAELKDDDGALISYLSVDGTVHALVARAFEAAFVPVCPLADVESLSGGLRSDLDVAATTLPAGLRAVVTTSLHNVLAGLAELLWDPVSIRAGLDGPVLLVPSGTLAGVPWSLLPGLAGRPLTVAATASAWAATRTGREPIQRVGLVAGPEVSRAEEEVKRAGAHWADATCLAGHDAVAGSVADLASQVDLLHVAAHGEHSAESPLFSAIELHDGPWSGYDIARVHRVPGHVVLSACELGRSSVRWGAETIGMTAAWLHAGASSVTASPTRVNDDVACEVLSEFHRELSRGRSPAFALAAATSVVPDDGPPAPFMCFGAGW
jgi:tetratricopeptide (TPR) repeat protein